MKRLLTVTLLIAVLVAGFLLMGRLKTGPEPVEQTRPERAEATKEPPNQVATPATSVQSAESPVAIAETPQVADQAAGANVTTDASKRVLEEMIVSKKDGSLLQKRYSYDESGAISRYIFINPQTGTILEAHEVQTDAAGQKQVRIVDSKGSILTASEIQ